MTDTFARMRQLTGTTAEWAANDLIIGLGEFALERLGGGAVRMKMGDGVSTFSSLPYFDPGIFDYVLKDGDTMTGPLIVPELSVGGDAVIGDGLTVTGAATFGGAVSLGSAATAANPVSGSDDDTSVATTHWVQQQIGGVISGLDIKGSWNAATNTPALASGGLGVPTPERGDFYIVSVAGTTTLDGISTWNVGDTVVFNGVTWQRVPQTLGYEQVIAGLGYVPVNKAGDTMTGTLAGTAAQFRTVTDGAQTTPLALLNDSFSAGTAAALSLDPSAGGVGSRDAQIIGYWTAGVGVGTRIKHYTGGVPTTVLDIANSGTLTGLSAVFSGDVTHANQAWKILSTSAPAAVASVDLINIPTWVNNLAIEFDLSPAADDVLILRTAGADNAFDTGASDYAYSLNAVTTTAGGTAAQIGSFANNSIPLTLSSNAVSATAGNGVSGRLEIANLQAARTHRATFQSFYLVTGNVIALSANGGGMRMEQAKIGGVQVRFAASNIAAGRVTIFGSA